MPRRLPLAAALTALALALPAIAQDASTPQAQPQQQPQTAPVPAKKYRGRPLPTAPIGAPTPYSGPPAFDAAKRLAVLTERLKLTPAQQEQMKPILANTEAKVKEARAKDPDPTKKPDPKKTLQKVDAIVDEDDIRIRVLLDGTQKDEWEKLKKEGSAQHRTDMFIGTTSTPR